MMSQEPGTDAGPSDLYHRIVVEEEVEQESYWENIKALVNAQDWASVLQNLQRPESRWSSSIVQLLQPMNDNEDTIVHRAALYGQTEVVRVLLDLLIKEKDNQELWRKRQANIHGNNPLHLAAFNGYEDTCKCIAEKLPGVIEDTNKDGDTPLHLAAASWNRKYTWKFLDEMAPETAKAKNEDGNTPIRCNVELCKWLVNMAPETAEATNAEGDAPIFLALPCHDTSLISKFLDVRKIALAKRNDGDTILHYAISGEYFDLASAIIEKYKKLISCRNARGLTPLHLLANNPSAFRSGCGLKFAQWFCYKRIKVSTESNHPLHQLGASINEDGACHDDAFFLDQDNDYKDKSRCRNVKRTLKYFVYQLLHSIVLFALVIGYPRWSGTRIMRELRKKKQKHEWAEKLMKQLVHNIDHWSEFGENNTRMRKVEEIPSFATQKGKEIASKLETNFKRKSQIIGDQQDPRTHSSPNQLKEDNKRDIIESPFLIAGKKGVIEMVQAILKKFPKAIHDMDLEDKNIMQLAAEHRQHEIFQFMLDNESENLLRKADAEGNSVLHLAANYPQGQPILIPGAALQMYYKYEWFKLVKKSMPSHLSYRLNHKGKTAMEVFIKTHQELAMERAKWLRNASQSCTVVALFIATMAFAASSTHLYLDNGRPVLGSIDLDSIFVLSYEAFCFSALSLFLFLGILSSPKDLDFGNDVLLNFRQGNVLLSFSIVLLLRSSTGYFDLLDIEMKYSAFIIYGFTYAMTALSTPAMYHFAKHVFYYFEIPRIMMPEGIPKRLYPDNLTF